MLQSLKAHLCGMDTTALCWWYDVYRGRVPVNDSQSNICIISVILYIMLNLDCPRHAMPFSVHILVPFTNNVNINYTYGIYCKYKYNSTWDRCAVVILIWDPMCQIAWPGPKPHFWRLLPGWHLNVISRQELADPLVTCMHFVTISYLNAHPILMVIRS